MSHRDMEHLPEDLKDVVQRLEEHRPEASGLELDRMKLRAKARATSSRPKGFVLRSRFTVALLALGLMTAGTGGVIAAGGNGGGNPNPPGKSEYKPGVGPCKNGGATPSGQHTGAPGNNQNCATKPGNSGSGSQGNGPKNNQPASAAKPKK